ncbi:MAG: rhodanese-like domain-containing protein [Flavobacteriales bacterium]|nr:rhodanese-like domain-containing protein [Flavobacteriales bacterium]
MQNLEVNDFKNGFKTDENPVIIDVRTPEEEAEGLIPNSINLNIMDQNFPTKVLDLDKSKTYYVYCRSGARSANACQFMEKNGLKSYNLIGGIQAWNSAQ